MQVGQYGKFNGVWNVVVDVRGDMLLIIDDKGVKKQIAEKNFVPREGNICRQVRYEGVDYLITKSNRIISLVSKKYMKWHDTHPIRKAILELRGIDLCKQVLKYSQGELPL